MKFTNRVNGQKMATVQIRFAIGIEELYDAAITLLVDGTRYLATTDEQREFLDGLTKAQIEEKVRDRVMLYGYGGDNAADGLDIEAIEMCQAKIREMYGEMKADG